MNQGYIGRISVVCNVNFFYQTYTILTLNLIASLFILRENAIRKLIRGTGEFIIH